MRQKAFILFFVMNLLALNDSFSQENPVKVEVRITRLFTRHNEQPRWNLWFEGQTNTDDYPSYWCFGIQEGAGWHSNFVFKTMPYYFDLWSKVYSYGNLIFHGTLEGYSKYCLNAGGKANGDYCMFKPTCYGWTGAVNNNYDRGKVINDFTITMDSTDRPGEWIKKKATNGSDSVEFEILYTPPPPLFLIDYAGGTGNVCGGQKLVLMTDCAAKDGDYLWQENNGSVNEKGNPIWTSIIGQHNKVLTINVPSNIPAGTYQTRKYRVFKRNGSNRTLSISSLESRTFFFYPSPPNIINNNAYVHTTNVKCNEGSDAEISILRVDGTGQYSYTLQKLNDPGYPILKANISYPTFPRDAWNKSPGMNGLTAGTYILTVVNNFNNNDNGGCFDTVQIKISEPSKLLLNTPQVKAYNGGVNISCNGASDGGITINASGGTNPYTYTLSKNNDFTNSTISLNPSFNGLNSGIYYGKVIDNNGCISPVQNYTLREPAIFSFSALKADVKCNGNNDGKITFVNTAGGSLPYYYSIDGRQTFITGNIFSNLAPNTYVCSAKDANGCTNSDISLVISEPTKLTIQSENIQDASCYGGNDGSFSTSALGGKGLLRFSLNNGLYASNPNYSGLSAGNYIVKVKDENNCISSTSISIGQPDSIAIKFIVSEVQCTGFNNGKVIADVSGGTKPYRYNWSNLSSTDSMIERLSPGDYIIEIKDNHNCLVRSTARVTEPTSVLTTSILSSVNPKCNVNCNGSINLSISGGTEPYHLVWNNDSTLNKPFINNLCKGVFKARVWDNRNCTAITEVILEDSVQFNLNIPDSTILCPEKYLTLNAGNTGSTYEWISENNAILSTEQIFRTSTNGIYQLKVTKPDGCYATKSFKVRISKDLLKAMFLLPSYVALGDTVVFVEVSEPLPDSIRWDFTGSPVLLNSQMDSPELVFKNEGIYKIKLTSYLGECIDSITKTITFYIPTGDSTDTDTLGLGLNKIRSMRLFPNPNQGVFQAEIILDQPQPIEVEIINSQGDIKYRDSKRGKNIYEIDFNTTLGNGVYLLKIQTATDFKTITFVVN